MSHRIGKNLSIFLAELRHQVWPVTDTEPAPAGPRGPPPPLAPSGGGHAALALPPGGRAPQLHLRYPWLSSLQTCFVALPAAVGLVKTGKTILANESSPHKKLAT